MAKHLHELIVFSKEFNLINSPAFYDCVIHLICTAGLGSFRYNNRLFTLSKNDIAVISRPRLVTEIQSDEHFMCEYIAAQFFTLIEAGRPKTQREMSHYASLLNVTPKYLSDTIKRVTGTNVSTHINNAATALIPFHSL